MLSLNTLKPNGGSRKKSKKLWRWNGSGKGTFCGRGMNGQNSRSGWGVPQWFEWGQTPLFRRLPKLKGFTNARFTTKFNILNLSDINTLMEKWVKEISRETLLANDMLRMKEAPIKVLGNWEITWSINVTVESISAKAKEDIEKAWGKVELV